MNRDIQFTSLIRLGAQSPSDTKSAGFSLVEMVIALVVSGILAVGVIDYIARSVDSFSESTNRNQLSTAGRIAINRLAMELHNSLPNSIRTTTAQPLGDQCIEFVPIRASTNYVNPSFSATGATAFNVIDFVPDQVGVSGGYAVIYPHRQNQIYDAENATTTGFPFRGPIEQIASVTAHGSLAEYSIVTLAENHRFRRRSPNEKLFIVEQPVSYCVSGDKLYRYQNYGFYDIQTAAEEETGVCEVGLGARCLPNYAAAPDKVLIADKINNTGLTAFSLGTQSLRRNSVIDINLNFTSEGDVVTLNHEVLARNAP